MIRRILIGIGIAGIACAPRPVQSQENSFVGGFGIVVSSDYYDTLRVLYPEYDITGGRAWLDFQLGYRLKPTPNIELTPGMDLLFNAVVGDVNFVNLIFIPYAEVKFLLAETSSPFLSASINYGIPATGDRLDSSNDGIGYGAGIGYRFQRGELEVGYMHVPMEVKGLRDTQNFGGIRLIGRVAF